MVKVLYVFWLVKNFISPEEKKKKTSRKENGELFWNMITSSGFNKKYCILVMAYEY